MLFVLVLCVLRPALAHDPSQKVRESVVAESPLSSQHPFSQEVAENPLASLDPVKVGFTRWVDLGDRGAVEVRTLALSPPLFLIKGFLTSEESQVLINQARARQAESSRMGGTSPEDLTRNIKKTQNSNQRSFLAYRKMFKDFDKDRSGVLSKEELGRLLFMKYDMPNHDHELFMKWYNGTSPLRMENLLFVDLVEYREWIMKNYPHLMQRHSDQVWLPWANNKTKQVVERAAKITGLPKSIVSGEFGGLQVLHYSKLGHYSCHYDSPPSHIPDGRVVRLGTMAVFLNDPEQGGQIAFPGADRNGIETWNVSHWGKLKSECQATNRCTTLGGVVVPPKKGDAVLWYNMKVQHWSTDSKGGISYRSPGSNQDSFHWGSLHCGAEVSKGDKWMANMWFRAPLKGPGTTPVPSTIEAPSTLLI
jgi:hypothetical protein